MMVSHIDPIDASVDNTHSENSISNGRSLTTSLTNPLELHHSDNPTTILVTPPLTADNYDIWSRGVSLALRAKNKIGFIDGTLTKPAADSEDLKKWERSNYMVSSWLLNSIVPDIRSSVLYCDTAKEIWNDLHERYSQSNAPNIYQLKHSIASLKQEGQDVSSYFTKLKTLWDELNSLTTVQPCICGHGKEMMEQFHQDRAIEFLQGLHDHFSMVRSQILLMDSFSSTGKIYALVRQEEKQQEIASLVVPTVESATLNVQRFQDRNSGPNKRPRPHCDHCNRVGHTRATCYKLHGYPPKKKEGSTFIAASPTNGEASSSVPAPALTADQYAKLLAMLSSEPADTAPILNIAGPVREEADWSG